MECVRWRSDVTRTLEVVSVIFYHNLPLLTQYMEGASRVVGYDELPQVTLHIDIVAAPQVVGFIGGGAQSGGGPSG